MNKIINTTCCIIFFLGYTTSEENVMEFIRKNSNTIRCAIYQYDGESKITIKNSSGNNLGYCELIKAYNMCESYSYLQFQLKIISFDVVYVDASNIIVELYKCQYLTYWQYLNITDIKSYAGTIHNSTLYSGFIYSLILIMISVAF